MFTEAGSRRISANVPPRFDGASARMAEHSEHLAIKLGPENTGRLLTGFLAEEEEFDRHALWRLGSWGVAAVGAIVVAALANQASLGQRREQTAAADLSRQATQLQLTAREKSEPRRGVWRRRSRRSTPIATGSIPA